MRVPDFDRSKPFYPLVRNFLIQQFAFKEMIAVADSLAIRDVLRPALIQAHAEGYPFELLATPGREMSGLDILSPLPREAVRDAFKGLAPEHLFGHPGLVELYPFQALRCKSTDEGISIDMESVVRSAFKPGPDLYSLLWHSAGVLLISAYALTERYNDKGPLWEFFRHCRNAAAHGGAFHLKRDEPKRQSAWGSMRIDRSLQGGPLFGAASDGGLLGPGDPILLLWDVEKDTPSLGTT